MKNFLHFLAVCILAAFCTLYLSGCSGGDSWRYDPGIPAQVTGLQAESGDKVVTLSWTGNPLATSYNVYYISELSGTGATKTNGIKINVTTTSQVISGLANNIKYYFMVTALNRDGESIESVQVSATPGPISTATLEGTWYFHTLVTGPDAKWERGTVVFDASGNAVISSFEDSAGNTQLPQGFSISVAGTGEISQSGSGAWVGFHGIIGSRKNMMVATFSPTLQSRAITIFQKKKDASAPDYSIEDISGTGSGQNPYNPYIQGNGPTRFAYHQLYSGSNTEWEYCNAKVGQHGYMYTEAFKDIIYWDFSTPVSKTLNYDFFWKLTSFDVDKDGLVTEYWNFTTTIDPVISPTFNGLVPKIPHDVVFTGRMTADKTVVVGVTTRTDVNGQNPQYFLRIMQLCFIPTDKALPLPGLAELAGTYRFHKLASAVPVGGAPGTASWAHGTMTITGSGVTTFPQYADSTGNTQLSDTFTLSYYSDVPRNPDAKVYTDFANFSTPVQDGTSRYFDASGNRLRTYYDYTSNTFGTSIAGQSSWRIEDVSSEYVNEHGALSYNRDLFVMTRTDASGYSIIIGLK